MSNAERHTMRESRKKDNKALFMIYQGLDETTLEMVHQQKHQTRHGKCLAKFIVELKRQKGYDYKLLDETLRS